MREKVKNELTQLSSFSRMFIRSHALFKSKLFKFKLFNFKLLIKFKLNLILCVTAICSGVTAICSGVTALCSCVTAMCSDVTAMCSGVLRRLCV